MLTARAPRSAAIRTASAAALLLTLAGCSLFDQGSGSDADPDVSASPSPVSSSPATSVRATSPPSPSETASVSTVAETCERAGRAAENAREQLREDPEALLAEIDDIAETAPPELAGHLASIRDAVEGYRQGDRSFLSVAGEARDLQERCAA